MVEIYKLFEWFTRFTIGKSFPILPDHSFTGGPNMRAITTLSMAIALSLLPGSLLARQKPEKRQTIEVAICLDTSNSMDGLIDSAKIQLWAIVNDLAKIKPTPILRVGLFQYGNDGIPRESGWIRKEVDLTSDLDELYKHLNDLRTRGGTEYATRVAVQAMNELKWTQEPDALKLVFVCGNEPANQDKETTYEAVGNLAKAKGILVNTIYCGSANSPESKGWKQLATQANGKFSNIDQDQAARVVVIKTPHDESLLKLGQKLNQTYVVYGKQGAEKAQNQAMQDANALKAAPAGPAGGKQFGAALERTSTKASTLYNNSGWDIIDRMKNDPDFDLKKLKEEDLGEELKSLKPSEREAYVKKKAVEREAIQQQIRELSSKRATFIAEEMKKLPENKENKAFDQALRGIIREQAESKGLIIPK